MSSSSPSQLCFSCTDLNNLEFEPMATRLRHSFCSSTSSGQVLRDPSFKMRLHENRIRSGVNAVGVSMFHRASPFQECLVVS